MTRSVASAWLVVTRAVLALGTVGLSLALLWVMPSEAELADGWRTPIIALELAQTEADVAWLAGDSARPMREAFDRGHAIDMAFPFAYAGVLLLTLLVATSRHRQHSARGRLIGAAAVVAACVVVGDLWENLCLLDVTGRLDRGEAVVFEQLRVATWVKWLSIAGLAGLVFVARFSSTPRRAFLCVPVLVVTPVAFLTSSPSWGEGMALSTTLVIGFFALEGIWDLARGRDVG